MVLSALNLIYSRAPEHHSLPHQAYRLIWSLEMISLITLSATMTWRSGMGNIPVEMNTKKPEVHMEAG